MRMFAAALETMQGKPRAFLRSPKWSRLRDEFVLSHPYCSACGCKTKSILNVHHILPFHLYPELELDRNNLIVLCEGAGINCHFAFGHLLNWKAYNPRVIDDAERFFASVQSRLMVVID